ncbi:MAG: hypothetical protein TQ35_0001115 [Candidatus Aramenus sulfurataquae]|jgi:hypothetical protein|uniref:Uncharacterized protein n=2 Tax=Candidatus Aramenus sulfurataquae TaxID=1326980 RepID=A0AAE3FIF0_9CREN|nr:hypothetical protein [Candidatus Aramenus sulfurataquae]
MTINILEIVLITTVIVVFAGIAYGIFAEVLVSSGKKEVLIRNEKSSKRKR